MMDRLPGTKALPLIQVQTPLPVSVIVLTYNSEGLIGDCLRSAAPWAGEIFVVDSGSSDRTLDIARTWTDKIVSHPFETYSEQRNWAQQTLPLCHEWVLHLDADERVTPELAASIHSFLASPDDAAGARFARRTIFLGRWIRHGGHYPTYHNRLFRRSQGACEERLYDQHFLVRGRVITISGDLIDVLTTDLDSWTVRHVRWAALEAAEAVNASGKGTVPGRLRGGPIERRRWLRERIFGHSPLFLRALLYFLYRYIVRLGFLDGVEGLIFHVLHGFWFRFYTDARIWENTRREPGS